MAVASVFIKARGKQLLEQLWQLSTSSVPQQQQQQQQQDNKQHREQGWQLQKQDAGRDDHVEHQLELICMIPELLVVLTRNQGGEENRLSHISEEGMWVDSGSA